MKTLTQPLGLRKFLQTAPKPGFDLLPFIDAVLIVMIIALNSSRFVMAPGATIDLVNLQTNASSVAAPTAVLTVDRNELYFFQGLKVAAPSLPGRLINFMDKSERNEILLIKADASISTESLFELFELAREAGFIKVQLAAEQQAEEKLIDRDIIQSE